MRAFQRICVYCGSNTGEDPVYADAAAGLGAMLAERGIGVVYGGGSIGLMGVLANAALAAGGEVIGVIPEKLAGLELGHEGLTELIVVDSMHARKLAMARLSDAFIALPGGFGTLEEIFEVTTWTQLNYHLKPVGLLNVAGFYDHLLAYLAHAGEQGFIRPIHQGLLTAAPEPDALLQRMATMEIPALARWLTRP